MKTVVTGGAGFIGSHLVDRLMLLGHQVTVIDSLVGGQKEFIAHHRHSPHFRFVKADLRRVDRVKKILNSGMDIVFHLAANADIARGAADPSLDFEHSLVATFSLLQAMKQHGIKKIVYTSGSGVYGDWGRTYLAEQSGPLTPVSMYGGSKLGAEGLISAFAHLFDMQAWIVRPANITGPRATHGVVFDFVRQLRAHPHHLRIMGDGHQSKSYLHVDDAIDGLLLVQAKAKEQVNFFNVSSNSFITVNKIAAIVIAMLKCDRVELEYTGGRRGWRGDVPVVRLQSNVLRRLGWHPRYTTPQAIRATVTALLQDRRIITVS